MIKRKHFLDNLRAWTVILVIFYHVAYLYNGVGILGAIPNAPNIPIFDFLAALIYPWFMVLLFLLAGISAKYALSARSGKDFMKERTRKLLVPSTLGLFVLHWVTGYLNIKIGGGLDSMPSFLIYPISAVSSIGPLWFAQMLFLFSAVILLLRVFDKSEKLWHFCGKIPLFGLFLIGFALLWGMSQIGNLPVLTMYRFGIYFASFMLGYLVFSHEAIQEKITKIWHFRAVLAAFLMVLYGFWIYSKDFTASEILQHPLTNFYAWLMVLAVFSMAKRFADFENSITRYLVKNSFGFYVLHYPVMLRTAYLLTTYTTLSAPFLYLFTLFISLCGTVAANEIIKRIPIIRFLVLGMK